jgi:membrane associated rhomboid family serine protease
MFPLGDDDTGRRTLPLVTYALIFMNVLFFLVEVNAGDEFIKTWAFIPARFSADPLGNAVTVFTSMFMHGGWMHLFGNMLYLWIFGDNVEDNFGHLPFLIFYLLAGIAATFAQYYFVPHSNVPNVGASGAIAGVLAAYLVMFPRGRVNVLLGNQIVTMSALIVIGLWIVLQAFSGVGSLLATEQTSETGGVAYMAHLGGFAAGLLMTFFFRGRGEPSAMA